MLQRLQQLVAEHLPALVVAYRALGKIFPTVLRRELELFLTCNEPAYGGAQLGCSSCGFERVIYYSCKRRSLCWRCIIRRRDVLVPHLMRQILPRTDMRHWVLTLPMELRIHLRRHPAILSAVRSIFIRAIRHHLRMRAKRSLRLKSARLAHIGAVSIIHMTSATLAANIHVHAVVPDGVFVENRASGSVTFVSLTAPSTDDLARIAWRVCQLTRDLLQRKNLWIDSEDPVGPRTIRGTITLAKPRTITIFAKAAEPRQPHVGETFHVWAGDTIHRMNRAGLKNLMLYLLSPVFTESQLSLLDNDHVRLRLKRPRWDGTASMTFAPDEFIEALTGLIRSPRSHSLEYHGVLGRNSRFQRQVLPQWEPTPAPRPMPNDIESIEYRRARFILSMRAHRKDFDRCPVCFNQLNLLALVTDTLRYNNPRWKHPDTPALPPAVPAPRHETRCAN